MLEDGVPPALAGVDCEIVQMDVREADSVREALSAEGPVWVVHAGRDRLD